MDKETDQKVLNNIYRRSYFIEMDNVYSEKLSRQEIIKKHMKIIMEEVNNVNKAD